LGTERRVKANKSGKKIGFRAVAVVGAIDAEGNLLTFYNCDYSVNTERFIIFLK
jgi:hypothetical protein